jgi:hypothetical protein
VGHEAAKGQLKCRVGDRQGRCGVGGQRHVHWAAVMIRRATSRIPAGAFPDRRVSVVAPCLRLWDTDNAIQRRLCAPGAVKSNDAGSAAWAADPASGGEPMCGLLAVGADQSLDEFFDGAGLGQFTLGEEV